MAGSSKKPNVTERKKSSGKRKIDVTIPDIGKLLASVVLSGGLNSTVELKKTAAQALAKAEKAKRNKKRIRGPKPGGSAGLVGHPANVANIILDTVRKKK